MGNWQEAESLFSLRVITELGRSEFSAIEPKDICTKLSVLHEHWEDEEPMNSRSRSHGKAVDLLKRLVLESNVRKIETPKILKKLKLEWHLWLK